MKVSLLSSLAIWSFDHISISVSPIFQYIYFCPYFRAQLSALPIKNENIVLERHHLVAEIHEEMLIGQGGCTNRSGSRGWLRPCDELQFSSSF
jgi:hypothetical protein